MPGARSALKVRIIQIVEISLDVFSTSLVLLVEIQKPTPKKILRRTLSEFSGFVKYFSTPKIYQN